VALSALNRSQGAEGGRNSGILVSSILRSDTKDKIDYESAKIESIFLGRVELSLKRNRLQHVWKDD
jgi:hypothetical protein